MIIRSLVISAALLFVAALPVMADEEVELLRRQVKELEARLDTLEKKQAAANAENMQPARQAAPASVMPQPVVSTDVASPPDTKQASVEYKGGNGLTITSPDRNFQFHFGGYVQADDHAFVGTSPPNNNDQFFIRSARPTFEAKFYKDFSARLMLDYGNGQTTLIDAYGGYHLSDMLNLRGGKFKDPIGIERWQQEQNILFVERGMTTNLVPYRDNGVEIFGEFIPRTVEYQAAFTNGAPDQVNATGNTDNGQTVTARVFTHPFYNTDAHALKGIGLGVAGSYGSRNASIVNPNLTTGYVTPAQSKFFVYSASAFANGEQWRLNPQMTYYNGPFSLIGEYVVEDQGVTSGGAHANLQDDAWEVITTYVLTGEDAKFDGVVPRNNFDPGRDEWGAFELAGRISQLHVDNAAFPVFASLSSSAREATETTLGGTWYMNPNIKLNLNFALTSFEGGAAGGDRPMEKAVLSRAQFKF